MAPQTKLIAVTTTVGTREDSRRIATALVERRLAACVQISEIESFYAWKGAVENDREFRLVVKALKARYPELEAAIRDMHPYELPAIYAVAVEHADEAYAQWVCDEAAGGSFSA